MTTEKNEITPGKNAQKQKETPSNKNELLEIYKDLSSFSHTQIDRAWKVYGLLGGFLSLIITVGLGVFYYQFGNTMSSIETRIDRMTLIVSEEVKQKIDDQFNNDEELKKMINDAAVEAVDRQIDPKKIQNDIEEALTKELQSVKITLNKLDSESKAATEKFQELSHLTLLSNIASSNIGSLKELSIYIENNTSNKDKSLLIDIASYSYKHIIHDIKESYERVSDSYWQLQEVDDYRYYGIKSPNETASMKGWNLSDYIEKYEAVSADSKIVYVYNFWNNPSFSINDKYKFLLFVLENTKSPTIIYTIDLILDKEAKLNSPEDTILFNKDKYIGWIRSKLT